MIASTPAVADRVADRADDMDRGLDVELRARHRRAVVVGRGRAPQVDPANHGPDSSLAAGSRRRGAVSRGTPGGRSRVAGVSDSLPMFPLNAVLFPGVSVPLKVFEDRYRALVHHLLRVPDPTERLFGSVGHPRGLRGRRARRPVAVPGRLPGQAHRGRAARRRHVRHRGRRHGADRARAARHDRHLPGRPRGAEARAAGPGAGGDRGAGPRDVRGLPGRPGHDPVRPVPRRPAAGPDVPLLDAGRRRAAAPCTSGRPCSRPRTPRSGW